MSGLNRCRRSFALAGLMAASAPATWADETRFISGIGLDGAVNKRLALDRTPALYSGDFGDCLGGESLLNVTKFDAAFYYDNSTVLFHIDGTTSLRSESLMMYISVEAYGEVRFSMTVDPCMMNVYSMCPMNASVPITAFALFQIGQPQVSDLPQIAFQIPDFEGTVSMAIFANSSKTQIGCFQAVMKNGASFSQPAAVGAVLGVFTAVAAAASLVTAAYGVSLPHMRTHYAHSLSVLVIFETFQSIFFSSALSVRWPSVLPAWWSNFAWSAGLLPVPAMLRSIDAFTGVGGNASQVGGAGSTVINNNGGLAQQIYGRSLHDAVAAAGALVRRQPYNASDPYDYHWNGDPVTPGMPIPGDWRGFAGTLSELAIPAADAFTLALIWLLVILGVVAVLVGSFKASLEYLARLRWIQQDRLDFFRAHWTGYLRVALLRTLFIAFFSVTVLAMLQFAQWGRAGPAAVAAVIFAVFLVGVGGVAVHALSRRLQASKFSATPDRILLLPAKIMGCIPWLAPARLSQLKETEFSQKPAGSLPFVRWRFVDDDTDRAKAHDDEPYVKRFGWLSSRYRVSRWWYFGFWLGYQFVRACFIGAAAASPLAQVFGLFIVDVVSLVAVAALDPYEGQRNSTLAVWFVGVVKLVTTGLSVAFLPDFAIGRVLATVIGVVIIVIQALLVVALLVLVLLGVLSSWMSLSRNREYFASARLEGVRIRYYEHIARRALDKAAPHLARPPPKDRCSREADDKVVAMSGARTFSVSTVRRLSKIEDEDGTTTPAAPLAPRPHALDSRANSLVSRHSVSSLPRAARVHRVSWSSRDFSTWHAEMERPHSAMARRLGAAPPSATNIAAVAVPAGRASIGNLGASATTPPPGGHNPHSSMLPALDTGPDTITLFLPHHDITTTRNVQQDY